MQKKTENQTGSERPNSMSMLKVLDAGEHGSFEHLLFLCNEVVKAPAVSRKYTFLNK